MADTHEPVEILRSLLGAAIQAAQPGRRLSGLLPVPPAGRAVVVGAGKASAAMAEALEQQWQGGDLTGLVVVPHGYSAPCRHIGVQEAAHPVPDGAGEAAAHRIMELVQGLTADDLVIALVSGGGSALLPLPGAGITLADKQAINRALLRSGATISEMNCVRRHLSAIKGGRLAALCAPAAVVNLLVSDIPGDLPWDIASGPTVGDPTTCAEALEICHRYGIDLPAGARRLLESGEGETVKPDDARLQRVRTQLLATPQIALEAAAEAASAMGITPLILSDRLEGEARDVGKVLAAIALQARQHAQPARPPCVLLSGGETTVTVRGNGVGGRNVECALSLALALHGAAGIHALCADTDGVDGQKPVAGAVIDPGTLGRARALGLDPRNALEQNDAHTFFEKLGDNVVTGPTLTNVNDFRAVLVL